ncbi:MAG: tRNA pseudouridine(13) synthase TruD [Planctomycetota bacterium]
MNTGPEREPWRLPYSTADVPGIGGRIKERPEDFLVEELPLYEPCGEGEHVYLFLEKRSMGTPELVALLAEHFGVERRAIGTAGLKDSDAVTRQHVSVHLPGVDEASFGTLRDERVAVLWVDRHTNKLRTGHLSGNRFVIRIRGVSMPDVLRARAVLGALERSGVPNAFGPQRFGAKGDNHRAGYAVVRGRRKTPAGSKKRLLVSAWQSSVFNAVLAERMASGTLDAIETGDLAFVHASGAVFAVQAEGLDETRSRAAAFDVSPSGPLWGTSMTRASGKIDAAEVAALAAWELEPEDLAASPEAKLLPGARRPLRVPLADIDLEGGIDEHGGYVKIAFDLPAGSYATSVVREVCKTDAF